MKVNFAALLFAFALLAGRDRATAENLVLSWNPSSSADVAGYNVYYGTASGAYTNKISAGDSTTATISNLLAGATYYLAATAVDTNGVESPFSNEISFIVPGALAVSPAKAGNPPSLKFPVEPDHWYQVQATTNFQSWTTIWQTGVATSNAWVQFSDPAAGSFPARYYRLVLH